MKITLKNTLSILSMLLFLSSCAGKNPHDPYEGYNRKMYAVNTAFDNAIAKPVAKGYKAVLPSTARKGLGNAFSNLNETRNVGIHLTQARPDRAIESLHRFVFNSTFGVLGLIDLTSTFNLPPQNPTDLGTTLAKYGWKNSHFFVVPLLGPSTVRDTTGFVGEMFVTPYYYVFNDYISTGITVTSFIHIRSELLDLESVTKQAALDPYVFQRESYMQYRKNILNKRGITLQKANNRAQANVDDDDEELSIAEIARRRNQENNASTPQNDEDEDELSLSELARLKNK